MTPASELENDTSEVSPPTTVADLINSTATAVIVALTAQPMPNYLPMVFPERESKYQLSSVEFQEKRMIRLSESPTLCTYVRSDYLLEAGDFFDDPAPFISRFDLNVNAIDYGPPHEYSAIYNEPGIEIEANNSDEIIARAPDGNEFELCWSFELTANAYHAQLIYQYTSGKLETFEWSFEIIE